MGPVLIRVGNVHPPGVTAGLRCAEHARHRTDREAGPVRADKGQEPDGATPLSRANQAAARERMPRSGHSWLLSRRSRVNSSRLAALREASTAPDFASSPPRRLARVTRLPVARTEGSNSPAGPAGSRPARTGSTLWRPNSGA